MVLNLFTTAFLINISLKIYQLALIQTSTSLNYENKLLGARYSGHADLIKNGYVIGGANTSPTGGIKSIRIWILN